MFELKPQLRMKRLEITSLYLFKENKEDPACFKTFKFDNNMHRIQEFTTTIDKEHVGTMEDLVRLSKNKILNYVQEHEYLKTIVIPTSVELIDIPSNKYNMNYISVPEDLCYSPGKVFELMSWMNLNCFTSSVVDLNKKRFFMESDAWKRFIYLRLDIDQKEYPDYELLVGAVIYYYPEGNDFMCGRSIQKAKNYQFYKDITRNLFHPKYSIFNEKEDIDFSIVDSINYRDNHNEIQFRSIYYSIDPKETQSFVKFQYIPSDIEHDNEERSASYKVTLFVNYGPNFDKDQLQSVNFYKRLETLTRLNSSEKPIVVLRKLLKKVSESYYHYRKEYGTL